MKIKNMSLVIAVVGWAVLGVSCVTQMTQAQPRSTSLVRLETIPPSPVTERITVDIRGAVVNTTRESQTWKVGVYLDHVTPDNELYHTQIQVPPRRSAGIYYRWLAEGHAGQHRVLLVARDGRQTLRASQPLHIIASSVRSTGQIGGAWCGIYHWSEQEGRYWNPQIKRMTDRQWQALIRAMHDIGMNIVVIQEAFLNENAQIAPSPNYPGKSFYPSRLYPGRMPIAAKDPFEAILSEADRLGMHVFIPIGVYAWGPYARLDYTPASLAWHKRVAAELWKLYGHHPSFYGWYVSEEGAGNLGGNPTHQRQFVEFFRGLRPYLRRLAPEKPVMLAPNCWGIQQGLPYYPQLLTNLDILCPFGFARTPNNYPAGYLSGKQAIALLQKLCKGMSLKDYIGMHGKRAAALLQKLCNESGTHLWLDMEVFHINHAGALIPRPISEVAQTLQHFTGFEETLCYQFPGLMTAPWMSPQLGGRRAVQLYQDYQQILAKKNGSPAHNRHR